MSQSPRHPWRAKTICLLIASMMWWFMKSQQEPNFLQKEWQLFHLRQLNAPPAEPRP